MTESDIQEALQVADGLVLADRDRHLTDLEAGIISGVLKKHDYTQIAKANHCTHGHIKDVSYKLWRSLSRSLGEPVKRENLKTTLLRRSTFALNLSGATNNVVVGIGVGNSEIVIHSPTTSHPDFIRGKQVAKKEAALRMKAMNFNVVQIAEALDLSLEEVEFLVNHYGSFEESNDQSSQKCE